jgi:hypothetical protein
LSSVRAFLAAFSLFSATMKATALLLRPHTHNCEGRARSGV